MAKASREFLYGLNPAFEALRAGKRKIYDAFLNASTRRNGRLAKLAKLIEERGIAIEETDKGRLTQLCGSHEHQGVVLRTGLYPYSPLAELLQQRRMVLIDNVEDPHNVGAILRSAEVFGWNAVALPNKGVPEVYPSVVKVSAGAAEFMLIAREHNAIHYAREAQKAGFRLVALDMKGKREVRELAASLDPKEKLCLVIGGEDRSVGQYILNCADHVVRMEQQGQVNSLNASVAAGIALFALSGRV